MALILHGSLNNDQYTMNDIFYPDFDNLNDTTTPTENNNNNNINSNNEHLSEYSDETESEYEEK